MYISYILTIDLQAGTVTRQPFCCSSISCHHLPRVGRGQGRSSAKADSLTPSLRGLQEAPFTASLLSSTSLHYHVRLQVQCERLMNFLRLITSSVPYTVLPLPTCLLFCKPLSTTSTLGKQRKLPELSNCKQE